MANGFLNKELNIILLQIKRFNNIFLVKKPKMLQLLSGGLRSRFFQGASQISTPGCYVLVNLL